MSAPIIQVDYESLDAIARRFQQQNQQIVAVKQRVDRNVSSLRNGGWLGQGSTAFFREMESEVNPAVQRLIKALAEAQKVTLQLKILIREAEEEAANPFKISGNDYPRAGEGAIMPSSPENGLPELIGRIAQGMGDAISNADKILKGAAGLLIALSIRAGDSYPGQVILQIPKILEKLKISGRWLREQAGLARHLNHIKGSNMARHIVKGSRRIPLLGVVFTAGTGVANIAETWTKRWDEYEQMDGAGKAAAMVVDAGLALIPTVTDVAGSVGGLILGAKLGLVTAGPVGAIVGGVGGAIGGGIAGEAAGNWIVDKVDEHGGRQAAIDWVTEHVTGPVAEQISAVAGNFGPLIENTSAPRFGFSL